MTLHLLWSFVELSPSLRMRAISPDSSKFSKARQRSASPQVLQSHNSRPEGPDGGEDVKRYTVVEGEMSSDKACAAKRSEVPRVYMMCAWQGQPVIGWQ